MNCKPPGPRLGSRAMIAWFGVPLTLITIYCVFSPPFGMTEGLQVLWVSIPLGAWIIWRATEPAQGRDEPAIERFRQFEVPEEPETESEGYRATKLKPKSRTVALKSVVAAPGDLAFLLERVGGGTPERVFELHPKIAYATLFRATELTISDHVTLLLRLEEAAPTLSVRPLVPAEAPPADVVAFKKDVEFSQRFQVVGKDAKAVRAFLSAVVRDALLDMPEAWLEVQGQAMSLSLFGAFDADRAKQLVELADVLFAEYGADGGPSLLEPQGEVVKKKKKKKASAPAAPAQAAT